MSTPSNKIVITAPNGEEVVFWNPFPKQIQFHETSITNFLARGSRGSGKTEMLRNDAHMRAMAVPGCNLVLIRKTLKELQSNHLNEIRREMQILGGEYNGTNHVATYPTGSKLFFSYVGEEADGALHLLSAEFLAAYFDEISTIPWDNFLKISASVRVAGKFQHHGLKAVIRAATNPFGVSADEVERYFVRKDVDLQEDPEYDPAEWGYIQINMEDNPYIDIAQYKKRFAGLAPHLRKAWLEGEFADEEALFDFHKLKNDKPYHVLPEIDIKSLVKAGRIYRSFDWGWHPDPSYCVWIAHLGNRYIAFHEKVWYKTPAPQIAEDMKEIEEELGIERVVATFCDPAIDVHHGDIRTTKDLFEMHGIPMDCSINKRDMFASAIHHALTEEAGPDTPKLQIYNCPYLCKALPLMRVKSKKSGSGFMDDHPHDHPVVALAYFLLSHQSDEAREMKQFKTPRYMRPKRSAYSVLGTESVRENLRY